MAEHDERNFEHEIEEMFKKLDSEVKIPEIPDAQSIFEKAEVPKKNAVPFRKYTKYIAAAAAVVLIVAIGPAAANALSGAMSLDSMEAEAAEEPQEAFNGMYDEIVTEAELSDSTTHREEPYPETAEPEEGNPDFGYGTNDTMKEVTSAHSSVASSSESSDSDGISIKEVLHHFFTNNSAANPNTGGSGSDDVSYIEEEINKKRTVGITVEKNSVSVAVYDNSANGEIINAFWVEGTYNSSYYDGEYYVINLSKTVYPGELETGYYLPMAGDANGTYTIPESSIFIPGEVKKGVISLTVEIDVGTGEYRIYASLV